MTGKKRMKHYPLAMKREAVRLYQEEGKSYQEITALLGIRDWGRVKKWLSAYEVGEVLTSVQGFDPQREKRSLDSDLLLPLTISEP